MTTDASCGAVNSMHDSYTPLGGLVPMANIMTGEVIFGGVGAGLYGMLMYAILAVFIAGLMVGRTPEYLGKKVEAFEIKMAMLAALLLAADVLLFTAVSSVTHVPHPMAYWNTSGSPAVANALASANVNNSGPHGFSEMLYAFDSSTGNNGSAFAGLSANTPYWNGALGLSMLIGRFLMIVPLLAIAGSMVRKKRVEASAGDVPDRHAAVCGASGRRRNHRRRTHLLPRRLAGAGRGTLLDGWGKDVLSTRHWKCRANEARKVALRLKNP